ncbi:MAG: hypothetical protein ABWK00_05715, partial [Desulfurococcaceae archaeon]
MSAIALRQGTHLPGSATPGEVPMINTPIEGVSTNQSYALRQNIIYYDGKFYIVYVYYNNPSYAEGNLMLTIYDPSTLSSNTITIDNSTLSVEGVASLGKDSILIVDADYVSGGYIDLFAYVYNLTTGALSGPFTIASSIWYDELPAVAYNPATDAWAVAYFVAGTTTTPINITQFYVNVMKFSDGQPVLNVSVGPFTTVGGNISYATVS